MPWIPRLSPLLRRLADANPPRAFALVAAPALASGPAPAAPFIDRAPPCERVALATAGQPGAARVAAARRALDPLLPGVYPADAATDRRLARALAQFPAR